jgi:hypothetical protein
MRLAALDDWESFGVNANSLRITADHLGRLQVGVKLSVLNVLKDPV